MKGKMNKGVGIGLLSIVMSLTVSTCVFGAIPKEYWKVQQPFATATQAGNNGDIINYGTQIVQIFKDKPLDKDKANILYSTHETLYKAYEKKGDYDKAIANLKAQIPFGEHLGFADGVKLAKERINKIDPMTEVYALTTNTSAVPYFGMKHEPKVGTYFGRAFSSSATAPMENESAVSFYVECLQEPLEAQDYIIRPYAEEGKLIHIALNMPRENESLKLVMQADADEYLKGLMEYLKSLDTPVLLRIGGEMNVWQDLANPDLFKQAYKKIGDMARQTAPNVALVFSPNDISNWNVDIASYYPGDNYVDWVGVSLYTNKFRSVQAGTVGKDHDEMYYGNGLYANPITKLKDIVNRYGNKKPIMITECGIGSGTTGNGVDLNAFAKGRIKTLYTYVNMVYPQVKAIVYFDVNLGGVNKYSLSDNTQTMEQYLTSTGANAGLIKQTGTTPKAYVKAGSYNDSMETIELSTYCILPVNVAVTVEYLVDGKKVPSQGTIPYVCKVENSTLTVGNHTLKVVVKGANGYNKVKEYSLNKQANNLVTIKAK